MKNTPPAHPAEKCTKPEVLWDSRAATRYKYKNEFFYTVTPLPAYAWRRRQITALIKRCIRQDTQAIADFGCGDGWYIRELKHEFSDRFFTGIDSSRQMLKAAAEYSVDCDLKERLSECGKFDLIYTVATLAHFEDSSLIKTFREMHDHLNEEGILVICEQSAPIRCSGDSWIRRPEEELVSIGSNFGFKKITSYLIDYPAHRWFERRIAKFFYDTTKSAESRKKANLNRVFIFISKVFLSVSRGVYENRKGWGYALLIFKKQPLKT